MAVLKAAGLTLAGTMAVAIGVMVGLTMFSSTAVHAYDNGMGAKPPLGWSTWCTDYICGLFDICTASEIETVADAFVSSGMKELGYEWLILDDCWSAQTRDANGNLQANANQFPNGMEAVVQYVHNLGLKIGLYTCAGNKTCHDDRPGSYGYYKQDAELMAKWGVDYVKMDNCYHPSESPQIYYTTMSEALNATGKPIWFNLCEWGEDNVWEWGAGIAQSFRIGPDHLPFWKFESGGGQGILDVINRMARVANYTKQYGWCDPDFLMTGMIPLTNVESETEFSFWALWNAPMLISTDVRNMTAWKQSVVLNKDIIDIQQDPLYIPGARLVNETTYQIWSKPLSNGDQAVIFLNIQDTGNLNLSINWSQLGWPATANVTVYDVWQHKTLGSFVGSYNAQNIVPHGVNFVRVTKQ